MSQNRASHSHATAKSTEQRACSVLHTCLCAHLYLCASLVSRRGQARVRPSIFARPERRGCRGAVEDNERDRVGSLAENRSARKARNETRSRVKAGKRANGREPPRTAHDVASHAGQPSRPIPIGPGRVVAFAPLPRCGRCRGHTGRNARCVQTRAARHDPLLRRFGHGTWLATLESRLEPAVG